MSRQRVRDYLSSEIQTLARQLLFAPPEKRAEVVLLAERFHDEIEPGKNYPIEYVVYRLTGKRVPQSERVMLVGAALAPDVRLFIDAISKSVVLESTAEDPCETTAQLASRLGVSTKTIIRWRDKGLRWRWGVQQAEGKIGVLFTRSAVSAFQRTQAQRVDSAKRFTRMDTAEKTHLIHRVRRLAEATDVLPQHLFAHLAKRTGRSVETLRYLVKEHDERHPDDPVFSDRSDPLTDKQKRIIERAYARRVTVARLGRRFRKTRSTIYRAVHERRAQRVLAQAIDFVPSPTFSREDADEIFEQPIKRAGRIRRLDQDMVASLPRLLQPIYAHRIDPDSAIRSRIIRYNFLKYRADCVQQALAAGPIRARDLDTFDELTKRSHAVMGELLAGTLPMVLSVVRRQTIGKVKNSDETLLSSLNRGNTVLIQEINRFDASLSHRFESVLTNRLLRELATEGAISAHDSPEQVIERLLNAGLVIEG